jgi:hypothetical protein
VFFDEEGNTCVPSGCTVEAACNFDADAMYNDGSCDYATCQTFGCNVEAACNYSADVTVNDGSCEYLSCVEVVAGCTNPLACNYDATATTSDGTCEFASCNGLGCTDAEACNYDATAAINDGSCVMAAEGFNCEGECTVDSDGDGVCDMNETGGCTDPGANNYDATATDNNGTCTYDLDGCMDLNACNFNFMATTDDGSCDFACYGCMNENACNFDAEATIHDYTECAYMFVHDIVGATEVVLEEIHDYSYAFTAGSTYEWTVEGGVIVGGQGTHEVAVVWLMESGVLAIQETNAADCMGDVVTLDVTGSASGTDEASGSFEAYPNPANDVVVLTTTGFEGAELQVLDAAGRVVVSERLAADRNVINVAKLANGTYTLVLNQGFGREVKRLVIAH